MMTMIGWFKVCVVLVWIVIGCDSSRVVSQTANYQRMILNDSLLLVLLRVPILLSDTHNSVNWTLNHDFCLCW